MRAFTLLASLAIAAATVDADAQTDLRCVASAWPAGLTSLYPFSGGKEGTKIEDGGSDMYDGGNEIHLRVGGQLTDALKYTQVCDGDLSEPARRGAHLPARRGSI